MENCPRPTQEWPQRVPVKVIGRAGELGADMIAAVIVDRLGPQGLDQGSSGTNCKGAYVSFTFWVTLPEAAAELPLREAIARLPGYIMQL
jgi:putative lipoic acid-binding regulatory protein